MPEGWKAWKLAGFMAALRDWMLREQPPNALIATVAEWGAVLERDPYRDADLEHDDYFFRVVPATEHDGMVVTLTYCVRPTAGMIDCHTFRCQEFPFPPEPPLWTATHQH